MKLIFDKLRTSDGIVKVSFNNGSSWSQYNVSDVIDTGITFTEEDCPDLTKIRIAGAITQISDIKTHIMNEAIGQDLTADEKIEELRLENNTLKNRFENFLWDTNRTDKFFTMSTYRKISDDIYEYTLDIPHIDNIKIYTGNDYKKLNEITSSNQNFNFEEIQETINMHSFLSLKSSPYINNDLFLNNIKNFYRCNSDKLFTVLDYIDEFKESSDPLFIELSGAELLDLFATNNNYISQQIRTFSNQHSTDIIRLYLETDRLYTNAFIDSNSDTINSNAILNKIKTSASIGNIINGDSLQYNEEIHKYESGPMYIGPYFNDVIIDRLLGDLIMSYTDNMSNDRYSEYYNGGEMAYYVTVLDFFNNLISKFFEKYEISQLLSSDLSIPNEELKDIIISNMLIFNNLYCSQAEDKLTVIKYRPSNAGNPSLSYIELKY